MQKTKGFNPMPLSLKIIFLFTLLGVLGTFQNFANLSEVPYVLFLGVKFTGIAMVFPSALTFMLSAIFLISMWNRYPWAWKFGIALLAFNILNTSLGAPYVAELSSYAFQKKLQSNPEMQRMPENLKQVMLEFSQSLTLMLLAVSCIINLIFIIFLYKRRGYFETQRKSLKT